MLAILAVWRHGMRRFPLSYDPLSWGAVFPLGMYTVAAFRLAAAVNVPALANVPRGFVYIALAAWSATFLGLLRRLRHLAGSSQAIGNC